MLLSIFAVSNYCYADGGKKTTITKETFRGVKANDSRKNPCKGNTEDTCYEKTTTVIEEGGLMVSRVSEVIRHGDGKVERKSYTEYLPSEIIVMKKLSNLPDNAELEIYEDQIINED